MVYTTLSVVDNVISGLLSGGQPFTPEPTMEIVCDFAENTSNNKNESNSFFI